MCGFKFLKRESYEKILKSGLENNDWFFCAELLIKADWIGMKIYEIPVKWRDNKDSRVELGNTIMKYIKEIKRLRPQKPNKLK